MPARKFKLGESVLLERTLNRTAASGFYEVKKLLPERDGEFEYHIKSSSEPHTRVAKESELSKE
jgi:hypothetical protein